MRKTQYGKNLDEKSCWRLLLQSSLIGKTWTYKYFGHQPLHQASTWWCILKYYLNTIKVSCCKWILQLFDQITLYRLIIFSPPLKLTVSVVRLLSLFLDPCYLSLLLPHSLSTHYVTLGCFLLCHTLKVRLNYKTIVLLVESSHWYACSLILQPFYKSFLSFLLAHSHFSSLLNLHSINNFCLELSFVIPWFPARTQFKKYEW